jgi:rare lipoprotein A
MCGALAACASSGGGFISKLDPRYGVSASPRVIADGQQVPKGGGAYRVGVPYVVGGRTYVPQEDPHYRAEGLASWYGSDFHGRETANGEIYDMHGISAAHPTLPLPSYVRVTNLGNSRSLIVRVNDRGPYHSDRLIDLSAKAARLLDFHAEGLARVRIEYVGRAPLEGSDDNVLLATLREGAPAPAPSPILLASSRPFLPQIGGSNRVPQVRGAVPIPPDRPYNLGDDQQGSQQGSVETRAAAVTATAIRPRRTEVADDIYMRGPAQRPMIASGPIAGPMSPAPVASFAQAPSVMTGRGLY